MKERHYIIFQSISVSGEGSTTSEPHEPTLDRALQTPGHQDRCNYLFDGGGLRSGGNSATTYRQWSRKSGFLHNTYFTESWTENGN